MCLCLIEVTNYFSISIMWIAHVGGNKSAINVTQVIKEKRQHLNFRGFSVEKLQKIDFSKIDMRIIHWFI